MVKGAVLVVLVVAAAIVFIATGSSSTLTVGNPSTREERPFNFREAVAVGSPPPSPPPPPPPDFPISSESSVCYSGGTSGDLWAIASHPVSRLAKLQSITVAVDMRSNAAVGAWVKASFDIEVAYKSSTQSTKAYLRTTSGVSIMINAVTRKATLTMTDGVQYSVVDPTATLSTSKRATTSGGGSKTSSGFNTGSSAACNLVDNMASGTSTSSDSVDPTELIERCALSEKAYTQRGFATAADFENYYTCMLKGTPNPFYTTATTSD